MHQQLLPLMLENKIGISKAEASLTFKQDIAEEGIGVGNDLAAIPSLISKLILAFRQRGPNPGDCRFQKLQMDVLVASSPSGIRRLVEELLPLLRRKPPPITRQKFAHLSHRVHLIGHRHPWRIQLEKTKFK